MTPDPPHPLHRIGPALAFLAWLACLCWLLASRNYLSFLAPSFWVLLVLAIAGLLAFAAVRLAAAPHHHGGQTTAQAWLRTVILLAPLAFFLAVPSPDAGSYAFDKRGGLGGNGRAGIVGFDDDDAAPDPPAATEPDSAAPAFVPRAEEATLLQLNNDFKSYYRRRVATIGKVHRGEGLPADTVIVFRFIIACCAADAQPVGILAKWNGAGSLKEDSWVRVEGTLRAAEYQGEKRPTLVADKIAPVAPPLNPYLN